MGRKPATTAGSKWTPHKATIAKRVQATGGKVSATELASELGFTLDNPKEVKAFGVYVSTQRKALGFGGRGKARGKGKGDGTPSPFQQFSDANELVEIVGGDVEKALAFARKFRSMPEAINALEKYKAVSAEIGREAAQKAIAAMERAANQ
jgi:hypothetical protein